MQTIELDCPPGYPRPSDLLPQVLIGTGLPVRDPASACFGCWEFDYSDIPADVWAKAVPKLARRISTLYGEGVIRYGSW